MSSPVLWTLIALQLALGAFDTLYHHELTERLPWRPSQARELRLHGARNLLYALLFLMLGWAQPTGVLAVAVLAVLALEVAITLVDFVEEDRTRRLPASERITHTLLALNYGAILAFLAPVLIDWIGQPTGLALVSRDWWSWVASAGALGVLVFGIRDLAAAGRSDRLVPPPPAALAAALVGRRRVLVTGATGFIGSRLVEALAAAGHEVVVLTRDPAKAPGLPTPLTVLTRLDAIAPDQRIDAIVNLAGEPLADGLWTLRKRRRILRSRLKVTREVGRLIARLEHKPEVLINASAVGWYGLRGDEPLIETSAARRCFSHRVCEARELAGERAGAGVVRVVNVRIGLVLGTQGGMLGRLLTPFEFGLGGPIGSGRQWMPWIALDDCVRLICHAIGCQDLVGAVNANAPQPVRNRDFARALGRALGRPAFIPVPGWLLHAALGDFADELLLRGQLVIPAKAISSGFRFDQPELNGALAAILGEPQPEAPRPGIATVAERPALSV